MRKKISVLILFLASCGWLSAQAPNHVPGRLIVQVHRHADPDMVSQTLGLHGAALHRAIPQIRTKIVAWSSPIMALVLLNSSNYANYSDVANAITYAADHGARIINISLGGSSSSATLQTAVDYEFAAASNNSNSTPYYPAPCNNVVAVSATTQSDTLASFSNYGSWITLSAPGDMILTTVSGGGYGSWCGCGRAGSLVSILGQTA